MDLLAEHRALIRAELAEVKTGRRKLTGRSFLGPNERRKLLERTEEERRKTLKEQEGAAPGAAKKEKEAAPGAAKKEKKPNMEYFNTLERKRIEGRKKKRQETRQHAQKAKKEADAMP